MMKAIYRSTLGCITLAFALTTVSAAHASCIRTVKFPLAPYGFIQEQICTADVGRPEANQVDDVLLMTQLEEMRAQNAQLKLVVEALTKLAEDNAALRTTLQQTVVNNQVKMRNEVITQLAELPGRVATDPSAIEALSASVANKLVADENFRQSLRK